MCYNTIALRNALRTVVLYDQQSLLYVFSRRGRTFKNTPLEKFLIY